MRAYEKEIIQAQISSEKAVISQLQTIYKKSISDINDKIAALQERYKDEGLQSIIYQLDYQKALKKEIGGILDVLQSGEYEKISDYLSNCYQDGFIGTMYSLQKQGIPLIMPMDQEQVINAIVHQSKISKGLYTKLGADMQELKARISIEVSRGLSSNMSYADIARNLENTTSIGINRAIRIARTEGHRIQAQAQLDASYKAKEKGADVVKQWDASLDSRTRPSHRKLDGQIRELEEPFEVDGKKAMCPGQFGKASEDVNCRCVILQRAKWALDEEELETLKERAKFHKLDKTKDFEEYKEKYLKAVEEEAKIEPIKEVKDWNIDEASDEWAKTLTEDEKNVLLEYTSGDGMDINDYLRERNYFKNMNEVEDWYKKDLEKRTKLMDSAIDKFNLQQDQVVYRRVKANALQNMTGIREDMDWYDLAYDKDGLEKIKKKLVGKEFFDKGYVSTALNRDEVFRLYDDTTILMEIEVPKGSKGAYLGKHSAISDQTELLLARGSKFDITDVRLEKIKWIDDYGEEIESKVFVVRMKDKSIKDITEEVIEEVVENKANPRVQLSLNNFPAEFMANTKKKKNTQLLADFINKQEGANPRVVELYSKLDDMESITKNGIPFDVKFGASNKVSYRQYWNGKLANASITLQDLTKNTSIGAYNTNLHELGHLIDLYNRNDKGTWFTTYATNYKEVLMKSANGMGDEIKKLFDDTLEEYSKIKKEQTQIFKSQIDDLNNQLEEYRKVYREVRSNFDKKLVSWEEVSKAWDNYDNLSTPIKKSIDKLTKDMSDTIDTLQRNLGVSNLEDIYDALSGGSYRDWGKVKYGHGSRYYGTYSSRIEEIFANYCALSVSRNDLVEMLRKDKPELVELLDNMVEDMLKRGN